MPMRFRRSNGEALNLLPDTGSSPGNAGVLATPLTLTSAFAEALECTQTLTLRETLESPAPAGWVARTDASPHTLAEVSFFDGDP